MIDFVRGRRKSWVLSAAPDENIRLILVYEDDDDERMNVDYLVVADRTPQIGLSRFIGAGGERLAASRPFRTSSFGQKQPP
mmetsp:Transcript_40130/g.72311  ORF Transcript_40130/g.72311 Transcript_40130/m.72311 type:complete len:81 (-) Transcript_40130:8-250(-)